MKSLIVLAMLMNLGSIVHAQKKPFHITSDDQVPEVEQLRVKDGAGPLIMLKDAQDQVLPPPEVIDEVFEGYKDSHVAMKKYKKPNKLMSKTIPISTEPGSDAQEILVGINYGVTITFQNANGEPLFVHRYHRGRDEVINVNDGNDGGKDKQVTPFLTLTNKQYFGATNLHVWLMNKPNSLSFYTKVVPPGEEYVDRITFVVVDPSDQLVENTLKLDGYSALTLALNNQKPSEKAERIMFDQSGVTGWVHDGMMWIRTAERLVFPSYAPDMALSSQKENGINVYYVAAHPIIHLVDKNGTFRKLTVRN